MCQMSVELRAMFDKNPPHIFDKIVEKQIKPKKKRPQSLNLSPNVKVIAEIKKTMTWGTKNLPPPKIE